MRVKCSHLKTRKYEKVEIKSECDSIIAFMHHFVCSSCLMSYELCSYVFEST